MSAEAFLDTNVLIYCFDPGEPAKQKLARQLVGRALDDGFISLQDGRQIRGLVIENPFRGI
jgi:predicted nucleic acid-binding protein